MSDLVGNPEDRFSHNDYLYRRTETFLKMLPEVDSVLVQKIALNNKPFDGLGKLLLHDIHISLTQ